MIKNNSIQHEILYNHSIWTVWQALTDPQALAQWLMPNNFEPQVGHRFTFQAQSQHWNGEIECKVVELLPPYKLSYTWQGGKNLPVTLVTFTLETINNQTRLLFEQSGFAEDGNKGVTISNLLDSGWGSKLQGTTFTTLLDQLVVHNF